MKTLTMLTFNIKLHFKINTTLLDLTNTKSTTSLQQIPLRLAKKLFYKLTELNLCLTTEKKLRGKTILGTALITIL